MTAMHSQAQEVSLPKVNIEHDEANNLFRMTWQSEVGFTYFIQHSLDLTDWTYLNIIEPGNGQEKEWAYPPPHPDKFFFRLHFTDRPGDPFTGDFDGDGLSNADEVAMGLNPMNVDTDGDGLSDGYELANALNPLVNDGGMDLDGDGVVNREDARPSDINIGRLTINISAPTDGGTIP